ncbi:MAG: YIP1 family protein [Spirochaetes bacterium]|nr:YIP1 family protein [Spirochaetota bacterium]MCK5268221.1 YIP1 family protein [Spirochaetota bacterium]
MNIFRLYLDALISPVSFFDSLLKNDGEKPYAPGIIIMIASIFSIVISVLVISSYRGTSAKSILSTFGVVLPLLAFLSLVFKTSLFHFFAGLWGGKGNVKVLTLLLIYSFIPFSLLLPASLIFKSTGFSGIFILSFVIILGYSYKMEVIAISSVYKVKRSRAFVIFLMPLLIQILFFLILILGFLSFVVGIFLKGLSIL